MKWMKLPDMTIPVDWDVNHQVKQSGPRGRAVKSAVSSQTNLFQLRP